VPLFDYTGQIQLGATFEGTIEAESRDAAAAALDRMGVRTTSLRGAARAPYVAPLALDDVLLFNEQLASMAKSGVPLEKGLRELAADVGSRKLKRLLLDIAHDLSAGVPVAQAVDNQRRRLPPDYANVVKAGVRTGDLGGTLYGLAAHLQLKTHFRRVLIELAAYPAVVLVLAFVILSFFMSVVAPRLVETIEELRQEMGSVRLLSVEFIEGLTAVWPTVQRAGLIMLAAAIAIVLVLSARWARSLRERVLRRLPGFANVYWSGVMARFTHTSALAAYTGTPLPELVAASGAASGSPALARATHRVAGRLEAGQTLEAAVSPEADVPAVWRYVVETAEQRGGLAAALQELARTYELRAQQWISTLRIVLGPLLLLVLAVALGAVVVSIFSALAAFLNLLSSGAG
jgi:type IV pilus assembly protein PilC